MAPRIISLRSLLVGNSVSILGSLFVLVSFASASHGLATPPPVEGTSLNAEDGTQVVLDSNVVSSVHGASQHVGGSILHSQSSNDMLHSEEFVDWFGMKHEVVTHHAFPEHRLRIAEPKLCDPDVQQYSGYLDISESRHLFFWFFEARQSPESAPLMMWLNGGPGCSSTTGLLFEMGPCSIAEGGNSTRYNKHSWTNVANVLFLDQPIGTGWSHSDDGSEVLTLEEIADDTYAFLVLFLTRFPQYAAAPFHLAGESFFGHMGPAIASKIHKTNKMIEIAPRPWMKKINFASLIIANGLTDPVHQFATQAEFLCGDSPYSPFTPEQPECVQMARDTPICTSLIETCERYPSSFTCLPAAWHCWNGLLGPVVNSGLNPHDIRKRCQSKTGPDCYEETTWIETWMNNSSNRLALGVDSPPGSFQSCNMDLVQKTMYSYQALRSSSGYLPDLVDEGVRLLVYAGNADSVCNYLGIERWMLKLVHRFYVEFVDAIPFLYEIPHLKRTAGKVRTAGGHGAGNVTFIEVFGAGHLAPHDQPEATLDIITRWIQDQSYRSD